MCGRTDAARAEGERAGLCLAGGNKLGHGLEPRKRNSRILRSPHEPARRAAGAPRQRYAGGPRMSRRALVISRAA